MAVDDYFELYIDAVSGERLMCHNLGKSKYYWLDKYRQNIRHRLDGPAIEYQNGSKLWWVNNVCIGNSNDGFTQEEFDRLIKLRSFW